MKHSIIALILSAIPASVTCIGNYAFLSMKLQTTNYNAIACESAGTSFPVLSNDISVNAVNIGEGVTIIIAYLCYGFSNLTR